MNEYSIHLPEFEGPLDLLLQMIERAELDITRVSLAAVADQYLEFVTKPGNIALSALADYLVIAARLILIKSRLLLSHPETPPDLEIEDSAETLARQLREYKLFKQLAQHLREREQQGLRVYPRRAPIAKPAYARPVRIQGLSLDLLYTALRRTFESRPELPAGTMLEPLRISIHHRIERILELTAAQARVRFTLLLQDADSRIEIIVTFLALLEAVKRKLVHVYQDEPFGEIYLVRREAIGATIPTLEELEEDFER